MRPLPAGERWLIAGSSGSGKSVYARWLLANAVPDTVPTYVVDSKGDFLPGVKQVTLAEAASEAKTRTRMLVRVAPGIDEQQDADAWDGLWLAILKHRRPAVVYVDEAYQVPTTPGLVRLLTTGRALGVSAIASTQRPVWISRFWLSEAVRYSVFNLADKRDRQTLSALIPTADPNTKPARFGHLYYDSLAEPGQPGYAEAGPCWFGPVDVKDAPKILAHRARERLEKPELELAGGIVWLPRKKVPTA